MNKPQSTYPLRLPTSVKAGKHKKTWARRTRLIARLHQTQPTRHERILQAVSDRAEILFFAYQPSRVQSLEGFVHRGSGEAVARHASRGIGPKKSREPNFQKARAGSLVISASIRVFEPANTYAV